MANNSIRHYKDGFIPLNESDSDNFEFAPRLRNINNIADDNRFKRLKRETYDIRSIAEQVPVPWLRRSIYSVGVIGLHEEINDFYQTLSPTKKEIEIRYRVIQHIKQVVQSLWSQAKVEVFGSSRTGLFLPTSDIDIVVTGKWDHLPLHTLKNALVRNGIKEEDISILSTAAVPLVRLVHSFTRIKVDISFNVRNGVKSAKMIKEFVKLFPALPKLLLILKQFLVHRNLNEVYYGGMSSYTLTILVISFLQGRHRPKSLLVTNLGMLLIEFFELYGINFNYEKVSLNILDGGSYRPKLNPWESYLSIVDPLCEGNDIAKGTYLMYQIKSAFENAYSTLNKCVTEMYDRNRQYSILQLILDVDPSVFEYRQWISENYLDIVRMFPFDESDAASLDVNEAVEEPAPCKILVCKKLLDVGNGKNKSRMTHNNSPTECLRTEFENSFEKLCSPNKHIMYAKQEWRNRNRAPFNAKDSGRYRRNSTKNCDR